MRFSQSTRILHLLMIVSVIFQLLSSLWMVTPEPGKIAGAGTNLFTLHIMFFGWLAFIVSATYGMIQRSDPVAWARLMPWFNSERRGRVVAEFRKEFFGIFTGKLTPPEARGSLSGAIHGAGFVLLMALTLTGAYAMLGVDYNDRMRDDVVAFRSMHELLAVFIWTYLGGHVFMVLYHILLGNRHILDIFAAIRINWK